MKIFFGNPLSQMFNLPFELFSWTAVFPAGRRRPGDVPWRSTKGPNVQNLQGTFRRPLGHQHKNWWFNEKSAIVLVLHIYYCFLQKRQKFKSYKWGRPRNVYGTQLRDVPGTKWWDVLGTSPGRRSYMFFKSNSETSQNCSNEKFSE